MNKGFILDGYPRNINDAKAIFLDPIENYEPKEDGDDEEVKGEESSGPFPGFSISQKILPQYTVIFEADNDTIKQKIKDLPHEQIEGTNKSVENLGRRLGFYREMNANLDSETHIYNFFSHLIGKQNCMLFDNPEMTQNQENTIAAMRKKLE